MERARSLSFIRTSFKADIPSSDSALDPAPEYKPHPPEANLSAYQKRRRKSRRGPAASRLRCRAGALRPAPPFSPPLLCHALSRARRLMRFLSRRLVLPRPVRAAVGRETPFTRLQQSGFVRLRAEGVGWGRARAAVGVGGA